jgi:hypothetical protein
MGRERYLLQRDETQSRRDIRESEERAARSRGGINLSRGIGRGLGLLAGLALAPATAGTSMLALAGGLGSLGGSLAGRAYGKDKYGGPEKANVGLFNRDVAREQRKGVDQYWQGVKEQTVTNTLQDAITAAMYGSKIKDFMAGTPKAPVAPSTPFGGELASSPEMIGDLAVPDMPTKGIGTTISGSFAGDAGAGVGGGLAGGGGGGGAGTEVVDLISSPTDIAPNLTGTAAVGGTYGAGVTTDANTLTNIKAVPTSNTAVSSTATNLNGMNPDGSLNLSGKSSLFSQPPAAESYTTDVLSGYGTGPNFLQDAVANTGYTGSTAQNRQLIDYYNQASPVQYNSVIDMLKAQGQGSSFDARTNLWNQLSQMGVR